MDSTGLDLECFKLQRLKDWAEKNLYVATRADVRSSKEIISVSSCQYLKLRLEYIQQMS